VQIAANLHQTAAGFGQKLRGFRQHGRLADGPGGYVRFGERGRWDTPWCAGSMAASAAVLQRHLARWCADPAVLTQKPASAAFSCRWFGGNIVFVLIRR